VGPEADGTIPPVQMRRLQALGTWLGQNGEAIYGTHPWKTAEGTTSEGVRLRFTQTDSAVYATMLGKPKTDSLTLKSLAPKAGTLIYLLGEAKPLAWSQQGANINITLPGTLPGQYAYVLKIAGPLSIALSDSARSETRQR
jgi:alpha-L-fucosidase